MKERASSLPAAVRVFMPGVVYGIHDDGRPLVGAYDGRQIMGIDLHRRLSVLGRMTGYWCESDTAGTISCQARLDAEIQWAAPHPKVVLDACNGWYRAADALAVVGAEVLQTHPL